ncbi:hypothetical protein [Haladaptatus caseinilyticus]|uniref:hypothetical protein n=1 Tax=Haladaptatus caseinilyticus TaxID=2993314 RepID=UPI00224A8904|nr:hypothetical protein [Haladaptatus caseinilyticus]
MENRRNDDSPAEDPRSEFDRGFDAGVEQEREFYERNRPYEKRRNGLKAVIGILLSLLSFLLVAILAIGILFLLFMGGVWLGALATPDLGDVPVAPVVPQSGVDGDVTVIDGDTTVTVAGSGGVNVPVPGYGGVAVYIEPTAITVPTNGDLAGISIRTGGISVQQT